VLLLGADGAAGDVSGDGRAAVLPARRRDCQLLECADAALHGGRGCVAAGLAISTLVDSEESAVTLVPIVLIPQIILSEVIGPLTGLGLLLARLFIAGYWGMESLTTLLFSQVRAGIGNDAKRPPNRLLSFVLSGRFLI